jgi:hypothetical protein
VKRIIVLLCLGATFIISSCSVKKDKDQVKAEKSPKSAESSDKEENNGPEVTEIKILDRDLDLIPDDVDVRPEIADIPEIFPMDLRSSKISYKLAVGSLGGEKEISLYRENIRSSNRMVRHSILTGVRNELLQQGVEFDGLNDEESWGMFFYKAWKNQTYVKSKAQLLENKNLKYVPYSGIFKLRYKLDIKNLVKVDFVENIKLRVGFKSYAGELIDLFSHLLRDDHLKNLRINTKDVVSLETLDIYDSVSIESDPELIRSQIEEKSDLTIGVENFTFSRGGIKYDYLDFVQRLKSNLANIIVSTNSEVKRFLVTPGRSLEGSLKNIGYKFELDSRGKMTHFEGESTAILMPNNLRDPSSDFLSGKILKVFGLDDLRKNTLPGQTYIISISKGSEIFNSQKSSINLVNNYQFQNNIQLENLRPDDEIEFQISGHRERMTTKNHGRSVKVGVIDEQCGSGEYGICVVNELFGWCGINTIVEDGYKLLSHISFPNHFDQYQLKFSTGKQVPLKSISSFKSFNSNKELVGIFTVSKEMISSGRSIQIVEGSDKNHSVTVGFNGYTDCGHRNRGFEDSFWFRTQRDGESRSEKRNDRVKTQITLKRIGALR